MTSRAGQHTPMIHDPAWRKIGEMYGAVGDRQIGNAVREVVDTVAMNPEAWQEFLTSRQRSNGQQPLTDPRAEQELYPPMPPVIDPSYVPPMPEIEPPETITYQQQTYVPQQPITVPSYPSSMPQPDWQALRSAQEADDQWVWNPPEYTPPMGEDPGQDIVLQYGPQRCWQCRPVREIKNGEGANMRTNRQGVKEYRHLYHCYPQRARPNV